MSFINRSRVRAATDHHPDISQEPTTVTTTTRSRRNSANTMMQTWMLEEAPPKEDTRQAMQRRGLRPPSPHNSDYQFNPERDDYDDDLMGDESSGSGSDSEPGGDDYDETKPGLHLKPSHHGGGGDNSKLDRYASDATAVNEAGYRHNLDVEEAGNSSYDNAAELSISSSNSSMSHLTWRQKAFRILHDRKHSFIGRILRKIFTGALLISVITMCLGTVDQILADEQAIRTTYGIEAACLVVFTLELILHCVAAPNWRYICTFVRVLDFLCVIPFYIDIIRSIAASRELYLTAYQIEAGAWVRLLDLFRVLRLFRVFPKSSKLRMMGTAFAHSIDGLWLLFYTIPLLIVMFSALLFYAEQTQSSWNETERLWYYDSTATQSPFQSIPDCFWIIIVTLTTIGYGDTVPRTLYGRLVCSCVMIMSLFVVAFPLTMITSQYALVAEKYAINRALLRRERAEKEEQRRQRRQERSLLRQIGLQRTDTMISNFRDKVRSFVAKDPKEDNDPYGFSPLGLRRAWTSPDSYQVAHSNKVAGWLKRTDKPRPLRGEDMSWPLRKAGSGDNQQQQPPQLEMSSIVPNKPLSESPSHEGQNTLSVTGANRLSMASLASRLTEGGDYNHENTFPRTLSRRNASSQSLDFMRVPTNVSFSIPQASPSSNTALNVPSVPDVPPASILISEANTLPTDCDATVRIAGPPMTSQSVPVPVAAAAERSTVASSPIRFAPSLPNLKAATTFASSPLRQSSADVESNASLSPEPLPSNPTTTLSTPQVPRALSIDIFSPPSSNSSIPSAASEPMMTIKINLRDSEHLKRVLESLQNLT
ncbi:hypothetical protein DFS34DRAFT_276949 [Phlyctochytrium arcticum]|nr:hypothetical protein DFS34DRAFT_276949 [Phlyctochytrium arcticum]